MSAGGSHDYAVVCRYRCELHMSAPHNVLLALGGRAPCDTCPHARRCASDRLVCLAFHRYVDGKHWIRKQRSPVGMTAVVTSRSALAKTGEYAALGTGSTTAGMKLAFAWSAADRSRATFAIAVRQVFSAARAAATDAVRGAAPSAAVASRHSP